MIARKLIPLAALTTLFYAFDCKEVYTNEERVAVTLKTIRNMVKKNWGNLMAEEWEEKEASIFDQDYVKHLKADNTY